MNIGYLEQNIVKTAKIPHIDFEMSCDVLCIGAGCAGIYAADAAAREGADVILAETDDNIGGMFVGGCVSNYYYGLDGGTYEQDDKKMSSDTAFYRSGMSAEARQVHMTERLHEAGVRLLCGYTPTGVYFDGACVVGVHIFDGNREINIGCKMLIDATSDGHIVRMCAVPARYGRVTDGKTVPFTIRTQYIDQDGVYRSVNADSGFIDQYKADSFGKKVVYAHANTVKYIKNGEFLGIASHTGIREGLSFESEQDLHYEDILFDRPIEKVLFYAYSDLDKHGRDLAVDEELYQNWWMISNLSTVTARIAVPVGCIIPKGLRGIVTAGRCFGCDSYAQSAVRMNRDMFRMGECVGVISAMAVKCGGDAQKIDYDTYVQTVSRRHCFDSNSDRKFGFDYPGNKKSYVPVTFDFKNNLPYLETQTPGIAIWSCFISDDRKAAADAVYEKLQNSTDRLCRMNCSIALGVMEDLRALGTLRQTVKERDCFYYKDCRRSNQFAGAIAVCLLGRLGTPDDALLLEQIVFDDAEYKRPLYHTLKPDYLYYAANDRNFVYFDYFTHAAAGLVKLYRRCGMDLGALRSRFKALFANDTIIRRVTSGSPDEPTYLEVEDFEKYVVKMCEK